MKKHNFRLPTKDESNLTVEGYLQTMDIKEKTLLYRAHAGDRGAAGTLYEHYYRDIYSYIFYRVNNSATAEALSAEVFVRMIRHLPNYLDQGKPFISWLYTLARKIIKDHNKNHDVPTLDKNDRGNGSKGKQPSQKDQEALGCFQRALQHLSETQKEVIIHRFVEGRSVKDIADLIQQSERAVRTIQYRALQSLEDALEKENCI
jgi:RNA polymerase sigma-70 factor (ECF subfamily)